MPESIPGAALAAAEPVLAAGKHGHVIKLAGLALIVAIAVVAGVLVVRAVIRRAREKRRREALAGPSGSPADTPAGTSAGAAVAAVHLTKTYQMGNVAVRALDDVTLDIPDGAMVCITGKSGSGKSTLLRQLGLIDLPSSGRIWLHGQEVTRLAEHERGELRLRRLGYVFQEYALLPELTAAENVFLPAMMTGRASRARAGELLELVGLGQRARHRPRELSGGEQQRVAIARALVNEPSIIYADEPTANLDSASARTVMQTLSRLNATLGVTVVFVSHDPDDAQYATHLVRLSDGKLAGAGPAGAGLAGACPPEASRAEGAPADAGRAQS